jgi:hypothetical protein
MQPAREFAVSKCKSMKGNESKFAFISFQGFLRIATFQWVTAEKNKKFSRRVNSPRGLCAAPFFEPYFSFLAADPSRP